MAKQTICDRCGKTIINNDKVYRFTKWHVLMMTGDSGSLHSHDLCDDCWKLLRAFINGAEIVMPGEE